jgi:uncharacterized damage-inducible protein DinB
MSGSALNDAFEHHVWATIELIDACRELPAEQLVTAVPGTYGSILDTMRHLVGSDSFYLFWLTGKQTARIDEDHMDLAALRGAMQDDGVAWTALVATDPDPDAVIEEVSERDGYVTRATIGIRLAQALHHGSDHRSQICTALTSLGVEPPPIDAWDFGEQNGRVVGAWPRT